MKQHAKSFLSLMVCAVLTAAMLCVCSCSNGSRAPQEESSTLTDYENGILPLFYTNESCTSLYAASFPFHFTDDQSDIEVLQTVIDRLQDPENADFSEPPDETPVCVFPDGAIERIEMEANNESDASQSSATSYTIRSLRVYLTNVYNQMSANEKLVMRTGLSRSLLSTGCIDQVQLWAPVGANMEQVDVINATDRVIINQYNQDFYTDSVTVTLYFSDKDKTGLVGEKRVLSLAMTEPLQTAIVRALIKGPESDDLKATIPSGTSINDVVLQDGVCYVDLSQEFQLNHPGGAMEERLTIYSIVDSLAQVPGVEYVQILINGERTQYYKTHVEIDQFLTPDTSLILDEGSDSN